MGVSGRGVLAIVNGHVVRGGRRGRWQRLRDELVARGLAVVERETARRGHASELAAEMATEGGFDLVLAVGGDGTVSEVAAGILERTVRRRWPDPGGGAAGGGE